MEFADQLQGIWGITTQMLQENGIFTLPESPKMFPHGNDLLLRYSKEYKICLINIWLSLR
jgi:hypothetical protein